MHIINHTHPTQTILRLSPIDQANHESRKRLDLCHRDVRPSFQAKAQEAKAHGKAATALLAWVAALAISMVSLPLLGAVAWREMLTVSADASVTQSALEEALASHMKGAASSRFSISGAFRSRYAPGGNPSGSN